MQNNKNVGFFITCLADLIRPSVAFNSIKLLEQAGCDVTVPDAQTCCGQPAYNSGHLAETVPVAKRVIEVFSDFDYIVAPSGSCIGMLRHHYPTLFEGDNDWKVRADKLAEKCFEITQFLYDVLNFQPPKSISSLTGKTVTYHDSCAGLRELGIKQQPRTLLENAAGISITEMRETEVCCGFGGTFCAKMPEISAKMASDKVNNALAVEADMLVGGDLGCLMNISGRASRMGKHLECRHVTELLVGDLNSPAIGEGESK